MTHSSKTHLYWLAGAILTGLYLWHCWLVNYVVDDSFITFRYVSNLLDGHGLVYNAHERVEGYTNFLWALLLAVVRWFQPTLSLLRIAQALAAAFGIATLVLMVGFSRWVYGETKWFGLLAATFLAFHAGFCAWTTSGLETIFFTFLVLAASFSYVYSFQIGRKLFAAPLLFGLAAMTRPEGILFCAVILVHFVATELSAGRRLVSAKTIGWVLAFLAIFAPYFLWRLLYYGDLLPNTFYAKVGHGTEQYVRGLRYLYGYIVKYGAFISLIPLAVLIRKNRQTWVTVFSLQTAVYLAYVVYVGGDGLPFYRFMVPVVPFLYLLAQEGFRMLYDRAKHHSGVSRGWQVTTATAIILIAAVSFTGRQTLWVLLSPDSLSWRDRHSGLTFPGDSLTHPYKWFDNYFVDRQATAARWLASHAPPGATIASTPAGAIGYFLINHNVIDMLGLNDRHIAHGRNGKAGSGRAGHERGDGKYVLSRLPDYILMGNVAVLPYSLDERTMAKKLVLKSEHELWALPDFHETYKLRCVRTADSGIFKYFSFYQKKELAPASAANAAAMSRIIN